MEGTSSYKIKTLLQPLWIFRSIVRHDSDTKYEVIAQIYSVNPTGNAIIYQIAVNRFLVFCNKPNIKFSDINYSLLDRFSHDLKLQGLKQNSISNYFRSLRAIYNKAIKAKIIDISLYEYYS
jgi:integrase/recombinase XerD